MSQVQALIADAYPELEWREEGGQTYLDFTKHHDHPALIHEDGSEGGDVMAAVSIFTDILGDRLREAGAVIEFTGGEYAVERMTVNGEDYVVSASGPPETLSKDGWTVLITPSEPEDQTRHPSTEKAP